MAEHDLGKRRPELDNGKPKQAPEPILDSMENVAAAILSAPPKKDWRCQQDR